ncbi:hypothetical protein ACFSUK_22210 [Sphingobium scionense]
MKTLLATLLAATALLPLPATAKSAPAHADLLIRHATLVDVEHGRLVPDQAVATRGTGSLRSATTPRSPPPGARARASRRRVAI